MKRLIISSAELYRRTGNVTFKRAGLTMPRIRMKSEEESSASFIAVKHHGRFFRLFYIFMLRNFLIVPWKAARFRDIPLRSRESLGISIFQAKIRSCRRQRLLWEQITGSSGYLINGTKNRQSIMLAESRGNVIEEEIKSSLLGKAWKRIWATDVETNRFSLIRE